MACYRPLKGYRSRETTANGKRKIVFNSKAGYGDLPVEVPCGQCIGCRLERSRQWAIRCVHEAQGWEDNCFITLTYNEENLPEDGSLRVEHFQKFMKRLRARYAPKVIRFFHCGEYGAKNFRPHYHAILFNHDFGDKELWQERDSIKLYVSEQLSSLWPLGFSTIGDVTFESAAYVARYVTKKVTGEQAEEHYRRVIPETGEIIQLKPEYITMSRRPGIGRFYYDAYKEEIVRDDNVIIRGVPMRPPKAYDAILEQEDPDKLKQNKKARVKRAMKYKDDQTYERLNVKEKVKKAQFNFLKRGLENEI